MAIRINVHIVTLTIRRFVDENPDDEGSNPFLQLNDEGFSMFLARMKRTLLASALMLGGLCGVASAQTTDTKVLSNQILPKDTYLYMSMPNVDDMKAGFASSSAGRLWADPAMDAFKAELEKAFATQMEEGFAQVQETLGLTVEELLSIPTGEVTLAFSKAPPNKMGAILFFDFGSHESEVKGLLEKATGALSSVSELESGNVEHDGTELTMYTVKADIAKKTPLAKEFGWFLKDERLVISNSSALLKLTLDNWDGASEKTLVNNEVFSYIMEKCESEPGASMMTTYVDPIGMFTQLVQTGSLGEAGLAAGMGISVLPMLGANQLKAMGSVGEIGGDEEFEAVSRAFIYTEQPPQGAMQVFQLDTVDQVPPGWVKDSASTWMAANWKVGEAYTAIENLVDMFQGAGAFAKIIDQISEQGPEIHIKNDVIDQLDGKMNVVISPGDPEADVTSDDVLFSLGVRDNEKMAELLSKLSSQPGFPGEVRELEGATIYEIPTPGEGMKIAFTVANNQLLIGVGGNQLEQAVRNDDDVRPLAESDEFKAVAEHFAEGALAVSFTRPAAQYHRMYDMLRDGKAAEIFAGMDELANIDFSTLPSFEVVEKYMAPTGGYWIGDENGVFMEQFSLNPDK